MAIGAEECVSACAKQAPLKSNSFVQQRGISGGGNQPGQDDLADCRINSQANNLTAMQGISSRGGVYSGRKNDGNNK